MTTTPAKTIKSTFSRATSVSADIQADIEIIWAILTNAVDYARWNSTIISIDGEISLGETILLTAKLDPKRTFKLKIKAADVNQKLVWGDAMGQRIFSLTKLNDGITRFTMSEKIGGPFFPLFAKMIPSFDEAFDRFAADLKQEAETIMKTK